MVKFTAAAYVGNATDHAASRRILFARSAFLHSLRWPPSLSLRERARTELSLYCTRGHWMASFLEERRPDDAGSQRQTLLHQFL